MPLKKRFGMALVSFDNCISALFLAKMAVPLKSENSWPVNIIPTYTNP